MAFGNFAAFRSVISPYFVRQFRHLPRAAYSLKNVLISSTKSPLPLAALAVLRIIIFGEMRAINAKTQNSSALSLPPPSRL